MPAIAPAPRAPAPGHNPFPWLHIIGRNAAFYGMSDADRRLLGCVEFRALRVLSVMVPLYFTAWQILGALALGAWTRNRYAPHHHCQRPQSGSGSASSTPSRPSTTTA